MRNLHGGCNIFKEIPCIKGEGESFSQEMHPVIEEMPLAVNVNGRHALTAMTSPVMLREFVTGFLYTERIIKGIEEIESIRIEGNTADVLTRNPFKILMSHKTVLSGCGGSMSFLDIGKLPQINSKLSISAQDIGDAVREALDSKLHVKTGGIHVVALYGPGGKIQVIEDIGRHNALDRAIGYALEQGIDLSGTYVICSGRISSEMVRKCLVANIPIIVSRGATTTLAVDIAKARGLTVVGFVRGKKMNVYSGGERISDIPANDAAYVAEVTDEGTEENTEDQKM
ncbi:MAG: formate dehydrogenase accessory sulfurtransferase FdhD [Methanolobus sp.]|uniref:formate dehydrogenase accessory sulfurtransferase FdhD n=1 Tax=Methanolobus sp. TaxID=1874737 RepID=UPI0027316FA2|nr:formate dehydrogenase accessory sulfurtransferase FdhD [Methanolobus sp.]MDP2217740.1 formate dehydrogenase accessory sulfurtransferase FdhD [Methanolobus sp.]